MVLMALLGDPPDVCVEPWVWWASSGDWGSTLSAGTEAGGAGDPDCAVGQGCWAGLEAPGEAGCVCVCVEVMSVLTGGRMCMTGMCGRRVWVVTLRLSEPGGAYSLPAPPALPRPLNSLSSCPRAGSVVGHNHCPTTVHLDGSLVRNSFKS